MDYFSDFFPNAAAGLQQDLSTIRGRVGENKDKAAEWLKNDLVPASKKVGQAIGFGGAFAMRNSLPFIRRRPLIALTLGAGALALAALAFSKRQVIRESLQTMTPDELH